MKKTIEFKDPDFIWSFPKKTQSKLRAKSEYDEYFKLEVDIDDSGNVTSAKFVKP